MLVLLEPARAYQADHRRRVGADRRQVYPGRRRVLLVRRRSDDMIKAGGMWVSPAEVEGALTEHPAVVEVGVVGAEDKDELVKPLAFVVLARGQSASPALEAELKAFVKERLAPYKYPRWIVFVDELPKTATGKIQRFKLREIAKQTGGTGQG